MGVVLVSVSTPDGHAVTKRTRGVVSGCRTVTEAPALGFQFHKMLIRAIPHTSVLD